MSDGNAKNVYSITLPKRVKPKAVEVRKDEEDAEDMAPRNNPRFQFGGLTGKKKSK